jgi:lipopolysaccharide export system protein LptA
MTQREQPPRTIVLAQDARRERAFRRARWNTRYVKTLRIVLPLAALGLTGIYGVNLAGNLLFSQIAGDGKGQIEFESTEISADGFGMANPRYEGFNADGSRFVVSAKRAITGLKVDGPIRLETIEGQLYGLNDNVTRLMATRGTYDQAGGALSLRDGILIETTDGMTARLVSASIEPKTGNIRSDEPVEVQMPTATVAGRRFQANQKTRVVVFDQGVVAHLKPEQVGGKPADKPPQRSAPQTATGFQVSRDAPIRVTAKTLAIRETENTAVFTTNVLAVQDTGRLSAGKLTVNYSAPADPTGAPNATAPTSAAANVAGNRTVEKLVAERDVRMTQGADTITARQAIFNPDANTADFRGGVRIERTDATVAARTMFIDQAKSTARLEGGVSVRQGRNSLKGDVLTIDQSSGRLKLLSNSGGLIATRFFREAPPASPRTASAPNRAGNQGPFSFDTDPNAPIEVSANELDVEDARKLATYSGSVSAAQGAFKLTARTLKANYTGDSGLTSLAPGANRPAAAPGSEGSGPQLTKLIADGGVTITSSPTRKAKGDKAIYDVAGEKLTLTGNVTVIDGRQVLQGDSLSIDMATGQTSLKSSGSSTPVAEGGKKPGRMRAVFYPVDLQNARNQRKSGTAPAKDANGWSANTSSSGAPRTN